MGQVKIPIAEATFTNFKGIHASLAKPMQAIDSVRECRKFFIEFWNEYHDIIEPNWRSLSDSERLVFVKESSNHMVGSEGSYRAGRWVTNEMGKFLIPEITETSLANNPDHFINLCRKYGDKDGAEDLDYKDLEFAFNFADIQPPRQTETSY